MLKCLAAMFKWTQQKGQGRRRGGRRRRSTRNVRNSDSRKLSQKFFIDEDGDCIAYSDSDPDHDGRKHPKHRRQRKRRKHRDRDTKDQGVEWQSDKWWWDHSWEDNWCDNGWHWDKWHCLNHDLHWQRHDCEQGDEEMEEVVVEEIEAQEKITSKQKSKHEPVPAAAPEIKGELDTVPTAAPEIKEELDTVPTAAPEIKEELEPVPTAAHRKSKSLVVAALAYRKTVCKKSLAMPKLIASQKCTPSKPIPIPTIPKWIPKPKPKPIPCVPGLHSKVISKFNPKQGTFVQAAAHIVHANCQNPMQGKVVAQSVQCLPKLQHVAVVPVVPKGRKVPPPLKVKAPADAWRSDQVLRQQQISADLIAQRAANLAGGVFIPATALRR